MQDKINLHLFDGAAAGASAGQAAGAAAANGAEGDGKAPVTPAGKSGDLSGVIYGKQPATDENGSDAGSKQAGDADQDKQQPSAQERRKAFMDLVNGEYKDIYAQEVQRLINARFKEGKQQEKRLSDTEKLIGILSERYASAAGDPAKLAEALANDTALWEEKAAAADLTPEQYAAMRRLERENRELRAAEEQRQQDDYARERAKKWQAEAEGVKTKFPGFDLSAELKNERFVAAIRAGVPLEAAYVGLHYDELAEKTATAAAEAAEKKVVGNILARGARPQENGAAAAGAFTVRSDPSQFSKADRDEIEKRVRRGEKIVF